MFEVVTLGGVGRECIFDLVVRRSDSVAIELGVAEGYFSRKMLESGVFSRAFGVDRYADRHNTAEYKRALKHIGMTSRYHLIRMSFSEALDLFPDGHFDFVYVDGYAHGGELGGTTIFSWFRKVRIGGVIAGDDYHSDWPLVVRAVDSLATQVGGTLHLTPCGESSDPYSRYPSWGLVKTADLDIEPPNDLVIEGMQEEERIARLRAVAVAEDTIVARR